METTKEIKLISVAIANYHLVAAASLQSSPSLSSSVLVISTVNYVSPPSEWPKDSSMYCSDFS